MTVTLAIALNRLARYLVPALEEPGRTPPTHAEAREALAELAGAAYKRLSAGATPERVLAAWPPESALPRMLFAPGLARARSVIHVVRRDLHGARDASFVEGWDTALRALDEQLAAEEAAAVAYEVRGCDECGYPPPKPGQRQQHHGGCPSQGGA